MDVAGFHSKDMPEWYAALSELDLEIIAAGFGRSVREWKLHATFSGDNFYRLYLPLAGCFRLEFEDRVWAIAPGSLYLVPPGTPFSYCPETPSDHYWLHFVSRRLAAIPAGRELQHVPVANPDRVRRDFQKTVAHLRTMNSVGEALAARGMTFALLAPLLEKVLTSVPGTAVGGVFAPVLDYVDAHLADPLQVEDLRKFSGMGRAEFSARFRKTFGIPPKQYLVQRRLLRAKHLLWRTRLSVKEIAQQCGFADMRFFCRSFKKSTGMTPVAYRKSGGMD